MAKKKEKPEKIKAVVDPVGAPSKYKPEYCQQLIEHMAEGLSFESFAGIIEVNRDSLYEWIKVHQEFSDAKKIAVDKSLHFWEKLGLNNIINISESESQGEGFGRSSSRSLNSSVWIFNMKNRFGWRDKQPDEDSININVTLADRLAKARSRANKNDDDE